MSAFGRVAPDQLVTCTAPDGTTRIGHYYRRSDGIWVCVNCQEPRP